MKVIIFIAFSFLFSYQLNGQTRLISGRVISEDLEPLPEVHIEINDTTLVGKTDINGRFKIAIPQNAKMLKFAFIGFEKTPIMLGVACDTIEIVMLYNVTYDFISFKKINKLRLKRFKKIPELHLQAYQKGLFTKGFACYSKEFQPFIPRGVGHSY